MTYPTGATDDNNNCSNNNDADAINFNTKASVMGNSSFGENNDSLYMTTPPMSLQMQTSFSSSCAFSGSVEINVRTNQSKTRFYYKMPISQ